jgi:geranylgeranyl diphosphate synthase type II
MADPGRQGAMPPIPFREFLNSIRPRVDLRIREVLIAEESINPDVSPLLMMGKRMRAGLLLRIYMALSREAVPTRQAMDLACAVELAHASSLILDDILDGDTVRRGLPALHLTRGEKQAMLDGIGILSLPYALAAPYGSEHVTMLSATQRTMADGVMLEVLKRPRLPATTLYDTIITRKTGHLFSLAAAWGAMAAGGEERVVRRFAAYGLHTGKAMQIADDIEDLQAIMSGTKKSGFGSEMLLLRCVCADTLCMELLRDIAHHRLDVAKMGFLWSRAGIERALVSMLQNEMQEAADQIGDGILRQLHPDDRNAFEQAVSDIVALTLGEKRPEKKVESHAGRFISEVSGNTL